MALTGNEARELSRTLIDRYFRTVSYPYTRHHLDSYDQFLQQDLTSIIKSQNPILILKDLINEKTGTYRYRVEIYVGGLDGTAIEIGTPTVSLQNTDEVRVLFPNEARLRNLTYASNVYADIIVKITYINAILGSYVLTKSAASNNILYHHGNLENLLNKHLTNYRQGYKGLFGKFRASRRLASFRLLTLIKLCQQKTKHQYTKYWERK